MKKYIFITLCIFLITGCGTSKRMSKMESDLKSQDSTILSLIHSKLTDNVKTIIDKSKIRIIYYKSERDSTSGEQLKDREEFYDNDIVVKDSSKTAENTELNIKDGKEIVEEVKEEMTEKKGLSWLQKTLCYIGGITLLNLILFVAYKVLKR